METSIDGKGRSPADRVFGRRIREARSAVGMSLADVCSELERYGVRLNTSQLSKLERAERPTNLAEIVALKYALRFDNFEQLLGERGLSEREALLLRSKHAWARLLAHRDDLRRQLAAVEAEAEELRKRDEALQGGSGGDDGEHPEAP